MRSLGRALIALGALGFLMGLASIAVILGSHHMSQRGVWAVAGAILGWSFIGTGLYAWWRRPENRTGALMTLIGFLWFLAPLSFSDNQALFAVGLFTDSIPIAALAHLILAFPNGRLQSRYHRRLIAFGYFCAVALQLPVIVLYDTAHSSDCKGCPSNPLLLAQNEGLFNLFQGLLNLLAVAVIILITREFVVRVRRARGDDRKVYGPVIYAAGVTLAAYALIFAGIAVGGKGGGALLFLAFPAFITVPFAFMIGLVRGRLSRAGAVAELVEALGRTDDRRQSLRDSLAAALGDTSLTLAYWIPEQQAYFDSQGQRIELPAVGSGRAATTVERAGERLALVLHDESLADEGDLVRAVGGAAALT